MTEPHSPDHSTDPSPSGEDTGAGRFEKGGLRYDERLYVPWWWWLAAAVLTGVVGHEIQLAAHNSPWGLIAFPVVAVMCAAVLWSSGRVRVSVTSDGELHANRARLPRSVIARGASIPATAKSAALGRQLDPAAYLVHRAWVKTMVLVVLDDPDDPTPYWLVSTRRPAAVLAALEIPDAAAKPPPGRAVIGADEPVDDPDNPTPFDDSGTEPD